MDGSFSEMAKSAAGCATSAAKTMLHEVMLLTEGAVSGAVFKPINAVGQIVDHVAGTHLPKLEFSNQKEVEESTAGKIGGIAGSVASFIATDGAVSAASGLARGGAASLTISGALQGGVLRPSEEREDGRKFFVDRLQNAAVDAATLATMGGVNRILAPWMDGAGASLATRALNVGGKGFLSGAAGGVVGAEAEAKLKYGMHATAKILASAALYNGLFGAGMEFAGEGIKQIAERRNPGLRAPELTEAQRAQNRELVDKLVRIEPGCSDKFVAQTKQALENVHPAFLQQIEKNGGKINLIPSISESRPQWADKMGHLDGLYGDRTREVFLAERSKEWYWPRPLEQNNPGVGRHEVGHASDHSFETSPHFRWLSDDLRFKFAHEADIADMPWDWRQRLDYFIQSDKPDIGRKEAFAELFAVLHGTGCYAGEARIMRQFFPRTLQRTAELLQLERIKHRLQAS